MIVESIHRSFMNRYFKIAAFSLVFASQFAHAQSVEQHQDLGVLPKMIERFLHVQAAGLPGEIRIKVGAIDPRLKLPACAAPEAFLPSSSKAWGKTTVGVRCSVPTAWTIYVSATVQVYGQYIAAAAPLAQGQTIGKGDIATVKGDLTTLPSGVITNASEAIGRTTTNSVALGSPLRQDALRNQQAIQQGQAVRIVVNGTGFSVSSEARALNNASEGQLTQVRTPSGQVVSGIAKLGGIVELTN
jgi:flagella basal body P-ring formation protein FlgA